MTESCRVSVLAYDGCFATEIFGVIDVLTIANSVSAVLRPGVAAPFDAKVVSVRAGRVNVSGGVALQTERAGPDADLLVVPGCPIDTTAEFGPRLDGWAREIEFLRSFQSSDVTVASVCLGAFLLAGAGLLAGRRATTAWLFAPELARRYPDIEVQGTAMVVRDGAVRTTGAFSAVQDLALQVVEEYAGSAVARMTSNITLVAPRRTSQGPFVEESLLPVSHSRFSDDVRQWLRRNLAARYDLSVLAKEHHVSTRTLLRRFGAETGETPLACLRAMRVSTAKRLLETSNLSVQEITAQVGYGDTATFRQLFLDQVGLTPSDYRRQVRGGLAS